MRLIIKAKAKPVGSISPSGKSKKTAKGWVPVKKNSNEVTMKVKDQFGNVEKEVIDLNDKDNPLVQIYLKRKARKDKIKQSYKKMEKLGIKTPADFDKYKQGGESGYQTMQRILGAGNIVIDLIMREMEVNAWQAPTGKKFKKARELPVGSVRTHGGVKKKKTAKGWVPVGGDKKVGKEQYTEDMLKQLHEYWGRLKGVDPASPTYDKLIAVLDSSSDAALKQLDDANIKFVSVLAHNRIRSRASDGIKDKQSKLKNIANEKDVAHSLEAIKSTYAKRPAGKGEELPIASEADLKTILENTTYCFVSAGRNPENKEDMKLTDDQVKERDKKLRDDLKKLGYISTPAIGKYGLLEDSIIVMCHDADKNDMMTLGSKYNQDSVLFCESSNNKLLMTTGDEKGNVSMAGKGYEMVPDANDFYTEVTVGSKKVKFSMALKELTKALKIIWKAIMRRK